ncbi:MAG: YihA family ribosome biogenesis GTP-binding protein [Alphaproteobacteria bacterium]|nr:MAG: YihA family ribosome biogenesis GTP-binding protein [Alphaproteobacteria bacterium]
MSAPSAEALEAGRVLFSGPCSFVKSVVALGDLPPADRPEICVAGRSNVGKSSLLNALTGRRALARTSTTPGRTQALNYFDLGGALYLVDLPGYGFAKAPKKLVAEWQALMRGYLSGRAALRRACLLIDSRHGPKPVDEEIMALLDKAAVSFQIVLTKADKPASAALERVREATLAAAARHPAAHPELLVTSARTGHGIAEMRAAIAALIDPA